MTEKKQLLGVPPRQGKTINQYFCPECRIPLERINETLFHCPKCKKKVKAMVAPKIDLENENRFKELLDNDEYVQDLLFGRL